MTDARFITAGMFAAAFQDRGRRIAVAVSGGGDSLALALLLQQAGADIVALTVDHQLRAASRDEALQVQALLRERGIAHDILTWEGEKPATHIQERARAARYELLLEYCRAHTIHTLALAHNLEDQMETFWMRLSKGSGLDGLAGMAAKQERDGVTILRPVMNFTRAQLRATCTQFGVAWIDDPSNKNEKFLRVKLRAFEDMLAGEGLTPQRLALTLQKLEDARDALQVMTNDAMETCVVLHPEGYATLNLHAWRLQPREIQRRVLSRTLDTLVPQEYPIGFEQMETARLELMDDAFKGKTLAGCEITRGKNETLIILRQLWQPQARLG